MDTFKTNQAIIATCTEMMEASLIPDNETVRKSIQIRDDKLSLWTLGTTHAGHEPLRWSNLMECHSEEQEDSTHYLGGYYFHFSKSKVAGVEYEFLDYCEKMTGECAVSL